MTVGYLNATVNRKTSKQEPEIGKNGLNQTSQNPRVDGYTSAFAPPRRWWLGLWMVLELNLTVYTVQTGMASGILGLITNSTPLPEPDPRGEGRQGWIEVIEVRNIDLDGEDGQHTTAIDCFQVTSGVGQSKSSHVKSVLMPHVQTGHVPYYPGGFHERW